MQTKTESMMETAANTVGGLIISWLITLTVINLHLDPIYGATLISVLCFIWSLLRSYLLRRYFNKRTIKRMENNL